MTMSDAAGTDDGSVTGLTGLSVNRPHAYGVKQETRQTRHPGEDPRDYGLTAADLHAAADRLYPPGDPRLDAIEWTHEARVRHGRIRSRLRSLADAIEEAAQ